MVQYTRVHTYIHNTLRQVPFTTMNVLYTVNHISPTTTQTPSQGHAVHTHTRTDEVSLLVSSFDRPSTLTCASPLSLCCLLGRGTFSEGATVGVVAGEGPEEGELDGLNPPSRSNRLRLSCIRHKHIA